MNKIRKYSIFAIMIILILGYVYWPRTIEKSYEGIRFTISEETFEEVDIKIKGVLYTSLFRKNHFKYEVYIDGVRIPSIPEGKKIIKSEDKISFFTRDDDDDDAMIDQEVIKWNRLGTKFIEINIFYQYYDGDSNSVIHNRIGSICTTNEFEDLIIPIYKDNSWSSSEGYDLIVTKSNIEEATKFAMDLMKIDISNN